jgi:hypothetical protein
MGLIGVLGVSRAMEVVERDTKPCCDGCGL